MNFNIRTALGSIAPTLATMLGGPLAGTAVTALEGAFGLQPGAGMDGITQVMQGGAMTPETIAAVRKADQEHADRLKQMDIDLVKVNADHDAAIAQTDAADRSSARSMQQANKSRVPAVLSTIVTVGFFGILLGVLYGSLDIANSQPVLLLLGSLSTAWGTMVAYWFGSTHDSMNKTTMIANSVPIGAVSSLGK